MSTQDTSKNTSDNPASENQDYEQTVLASDLGTITLTNTGKGAIYIGLAHGNSPHTRPEIQIQLTERQVETSAAILSDWSNGEIAEDE